MLYSSLYPGALLYTVEIAGKVIQSNSGEEKVQLHVNVD